MTIRQSALPRAPLADWVRYAHRKLQTRRQTAGGWRSGVARRTESATRRQVDARMAVFVRRAWCAAGWFMARVETRTRLRPWPMSMAFTSTRLRGDAAQEPLMIVYHLTVLFSLRQ